MFNEFVTADAVFFFCKDRKPMFRLKANIYFYDHDLTVFIKPTER